MATKWGGARRGTGPKPKPVSDTHRELGARWYCAQTHPREEYRALGEVWKAEFRAYLPHLIPEGAPAAQLMFPGYLFVRFDALADPWRRLASVRGIRRLFGSSPECPLPLPVGTVEDWQARGRPGDGVIDARRTPRQLVGTDVRIVAGPLSDFVGFCKLADADRVTVLLTIFGRATTVELGRREVRPA